MIILCIAYWFRPSLLIVVDYFVIYKLNQLIVLFLHASIS